MLKLKGHYDLALINKNSISENILNSISNEKMNIWDLIEEKTIIPDQIIGKDNLISDKGLFLLNGQNSNTTFDGFIGQLFVSTSITQERSGIVQTGPVAVNLITLDNNASNTDDFYNGASITIVSGLGSGQTRIISDYVGGSKLATVSVNWVTIPNNTSSFHISPLIDYRKQTGNMGFNLDAVGVPTNRLISGTSWQGQYNFPAPVSSLIINIIGLTSQSGDIISFINLSTPITQTSSHLLFVRYIIQGTYSNLTGLGGVSNPWVQDSINNSLFKLHLFNFDIQCMSRFLNPVNYNKVTRQPFDINTYTQAFGGPIIPPSFYLRDNSKFSKTTKWELETSNLPGPHGCAYVNPAIVINPITNMSSGSNNTGSLPVISVLDQDQTIRIGTMFKHAENDISIFSNPEMPPLSTGNVNISGSSNVNKIFKKISALITKTGDASDIYPDIFTYSGADNIFSVSQDWNYLPNASSIITCEVSTDDTLPSPLLISTTYYVIYINSTQIKLASTEQNAIDGIAITIIDSGTGNHTIIRTSTGTFKLATNLYTDILTPNINCVHIRPTFLGSNIQNTFDDEWDMDVLDVPPFGYYKNRTLKVGWGQLINDFLYFSHEERADLTNQWICKWRFNTVEGSDSLVLLNTQNGAVTYTNTIWIATNNGLVEFDTGTDTILNTYTDANGLLNNIINDIVIDPITNFIWLGHNNGLTKWNPITKTVLSTHTNTTGETFDGMTIDGIRVLRGQLSAYDGLVCWGGKLAYDYSANSDRDSPRIYDDNTGYWVILPIINLTTQNCNSVTLVGDGTKKIIINSTLYGSNPYTIEVWTITLTGAGTGTFLISTNTLSTNVYFNFGSRIHRISKDHFSELPICTDNIDQFDYILSTDKITHKPSVGIRGSGNQFVDSNSNRTNPIESNMFEVNGVKLIWNHGYIFPTLNDQLFGWTGSVWDRDSLESRNIPDTSISNLVNNIDFDFDNFGGQPPQSQFKINENMMVVTGPGIIKSNLQTMNYTMHSYMAELKYSTENITPLNSTSYTTTLSTLKDFLSIEDDADYITITDTTSSITLLQVPSAPASGQYSVTGGGQFTFNSAQISHNLILNFYYIERH